MINRSTRREKGSFRTTLSNAIKNVQDSLRLFGNDSGKGLSSVVISSNVTLGASKPTDTGVAVWFTWDGLGVCIPVDRYESVEANLQAIHHIIEARRVELRHGTLALVRASFQGFRALPSPSKKDWHSILGVSPTQVTKGGIEAAYRERAKVAHPDTGGSQQAMAELNAARDAALASLK